MKCLIVLATFAVVASAARYQSQLAGAASSGTSSQFRSEDDYGNFNFGYDESHPSGSTSRHEEQASGVRRGSYSLGDADGRQRTVNYVADAAGFRATIRTNEPGVESKDPADVVIYRDDIEQAPDYGAPAPAASPLAPKGYAAPRVVDPRPAPVDAYAPVYETIALPRAFSYSFETNHVAPIAATGYAGSNPLRAPVYQRRLEY